MTTFWRTSPDRPSQAPHGDPLGPHLETGPRPERAPGLGPLSRVLALVPHYRCEEWLPDALASLVAQSLPLDGIAVIDDGSESPPVELVARFPRVTLLHASRNAGPYALIQSVISMTGYDAYLFNDADDWSATHRLEVLLSAARETGAELVGSQEVRVDCREAETYLASYPLDVNLALREQPCAFPLLHPTSLVGRDLVMRLGGFATGMRFSGDAEFLRRATYSARVVNVPAYLYFRRKREGALTTSPDTGLESEARRTVQAQLWRRARRNADRVARGLAPDLRPLTVVEPVDLRHLTGPALRPARGTDRHGGQPVPRRGARLRPWWQGAGPSDPGRDDVRAP